jgi:hypothetical protein
VSLIHLAWFCKNGSNFACSGIYMCVCVLCPTCYLICCNVIVSQHSLPYRLSTQERVKASNRHTFHATYFPTLNTSP